jgi:hypothetical protein
LSSEDSPSGTLRLDRITLLISHDRSGSHYLGSFIRTLPNHVMVDEICNEEALDPERAKLSFFGFRHRRARERPEYSLRRNPETVQALLDEYFSFVLESAPGKAGVTIDIKYGHIHNFEIAWWPIFRKPFLFQYAKKRGLKIIHLSRWNSLQTIISGQVAESRAVWHAIDDKKPATAADAIVLEKQRLPRRIAMLNEQKGAIAKWTRDCRCLSVLYEEFVDPSGAPECRARIARFLGTSAGAEFSSAYKKVTPPPEVIVANWEEVGEFCRENELGHYLLPFAS